MLDAAVCWKPDVPGRAGILACPNTGLEACIHSVRGNQQATPRRKFAGARGVLRDYEQRGCDAEEIVQPPPECGIGR